MSDIRLPIRQLVEFLLRSGSIDSRFAGFDRALEGARIHRRLQKAAGEGYAAEVPLCADYTVDGIRFTLEGRADGIFTNETGVVTIDEIKTTAVPEEEICEDMNPCHWAQGMVYGAICAEQRELETLDVRLTYYQIDTDEIIRYTRHFSAAELDAFLNDLLRQYLPWARRQLDWVEARNRSLWALQFPFPAYRPGQRALAGEVYRACAAGKAEQKGGTRLFCQAPTGIGKTMSALFPALKAMGEGKGEKIFYLTARNTTQAAAEDALARLRAADPALSLRSVTLSAKEKACLCKDAEGRPACLPEACPYANGYFDRVKTALWDGLDTPTLTADALRELARRHRVCPFELGLDLSLWCDVVIGDYNYLFDPVVHLARFFESRGDYLFLVDEAHNLPGRARDMHSASLCKSAFFDARKRLGKGKSSLKNALTKINNLFIEWRHRCEEAEGRTFFARERADAFDRALQKLCEPLEIWLDEHRDPDETHEALLQLFFDVRGWLRVADTFDDHFVLQVSAYGSEVRVSMLCLDPHEFLQADFAKGRAAVLFSATLSPAGYYKDLCGVPEARAVALRSPFPAENLGLWCARNISTRYKDRADSMEKIAALLYEMVCARAGNYLAFFPSYSYLEQVREVFCTAHLEVETLRQDTAMDEASRADFLAQFTAAPGRTLLGFAVLGGVFGEGVDLAGERLIGAAIVSPGLPQVGPRQEQLRAHFEETRGSGFDYAYRFPGMNKVLQAAGRVIRTPEDKGVVLLIDDRFLAPDTRRLMPPHWDGLRAVGSAEELRAELEWFWNNK